MIEVYVGIFEMLQVSLLICWKNVRIVITSYILLVFICLINLVIENYMSFDAWTELRMKWRLRPKNILSWVMMLPLKPKLKYALFMWGQFFYVCHNPQSVSLFIFAFSMLFQSISFRHLVRYSTTKQKCTSYHLQPFH